MGKTVFGVIFDMDGVLIDSAEPHFRSWQLLAAERGTTVTREQFQITFGRQNKDVMPVLLGESAPDRVELLSDRKEEIYRELVRLAPPIVPGAVELVRALSLAGALLAVGSSGPRANINLVLDAMGATGLFSAIVSGEDVTRGKPHPQVFSLACDKLRLEPRKCVVIEDAPVGVEAAKAAGTKVVAVLMQHPREAFLPADLIVDRLSDLTIGHLTTLV
jgi:beta-phosphoglucomutase